MSRSARLPAPSAGTAHPKRFVFLDGLRGVAALGILAGHLPTFVEIPHYPTGFAFGLAVDFFFILSGFVLAHAYRERLLQGLDFAAFTRARIIRLFPLMALGTTLGAILTVLHVWANSDTAWWRVWLTIGLGYLSLPSFWLGLWDFPFPLNAPHWSLFFELIVNLFFAVAAFRLRPRGLLAIVFVSFFIELACVAHYDTFGGAISSAFLLGFPRVFLGFFIGVLLQHLRPSPALGKLSGLALAALLAGALLSPLHLTQVQLLGVIVIVFPPLIYFASGVRVNGAGASVCKMLGDISYPLYLLHFPIIRVLDEVFKRLDPTRQYVYAEVLFEALFCIAAAYAALKLYDEPVRAALSRYFAAKRFGLSSRDKPTPGVEMKAPANSVSVVLASCNGARYIEPQLRSIMAQTAPPIELIVADDLSSDNTLDIVRDVTRGCAFDVRIVSNERRLGFRDNFLRNALQARGSLIAFCDQDDIWSPHKLATCAARFDNDYRITLAAHTARLIDAESKPIGMFRQGIKETVYKPPLSYDPWSTFWGFSMVFRREILHLVDIGDRFIDFIEPSERIAHDRWIMFLAQMTGTIAEIDEPLVQYRQHGANLFGRRKNIATPLRERSKVYIAATAQMIEIVENLPAAAADRFPQFNCDECLLYLRQALMQLMQRDRVYNAPTFRTAVGSITDCFAGGYYRSVHEGRIRWPSVMRDIYASAKRGHANTDAISR